MVKPTLYMETSIPSYLLAQPARDVVAAGRQETTRTWWTRQNGHFSIYISDVVLREVNKGDRSAAKKRLEFLAPFPVLEVIPDVESTIALYVRKRVVSIGSAADAAHLAFANVYGIEFLCTWNFKHLANAFALRRLREVNDNHGLFTPQVCTPEELLGE